MTASKLSLCATGATRARALADAFEMLIAPPPEAVTQFEHGPDAWCVEAYFAAPPDVDSVGRQLASIAGEAVALELADVPDLNWVALSQAALPPVGAGRFIVYGSHDRGRIARGPNAILIDAGEAFGTAHHATTLGCLLAIDRLARSHTFRRVLDLGCGSGVLAIAAARALPAAAILASDSDMQAVAVAAGNAKANGVARRIGFVHASGLAHPALRHPASFDLIIANILAKPLRDLAPDLRAALRGDGALVLSGLLDVEARPLIAAYRSHGFIVTEHRCIAGWSTLTLRTPGRPRARVAEPSRISERSALVANCPPATGRLKKAHVPDLRAYRPGRRRRRAHQDAAPAYGAGRRRRLPRAAHR